uniref:Uncharacterized protein n=1 Tax=Clytia hemisphaerica TaxID=252671 RepID=A0A7M6DPA4_9CNID
MDDLHKNDDYDAVTFFYHKTKRKRTFQFRCTEDPMKRALSNQGTLKTLRSVFENLVSAVEKEEEKEKNGSATSTSTQAETETTTATKTGTWTATATETTTARAT